MLLSLLKKRTAKEVHGTMDMKPERNILKYGKLFLAFIIIENCVPIYTNLINSMCTRQGGGGGGREKTHHGTLCNDTLRPWLKGQ